jgi:hypothetical protein
MLTSNVSESKRDESGNTFDVEFNSNPPTHRCGHTGGGTAEVLDPPYELSIVNRTYTLPRLTRKPLRNLFARLYFSASPHLGDKCYSIS